MPLIIKKRDSRDLNCRHIDEKAKLINNSINEVIKDSGFDSIIYSLKNEIDDVMSYVDYVKGCITRKDGVDILPMVLSSRADDMCFMEHFIEKNRDDIISGYLDDIAGTFKAGVEDMSYVDGIYMKVKELEKATALLNQGIKKCVDDLVTRYYNPAIKELEEKINKFEDEDTVVIMHDEIYAGKFVACKIEPWEFTIRGEAGDEITFQDKLSRYMIGGTIMDDERGKNRDI